MDSHHLLLEKTISLPMIVNVIVSAPRTASRVQRICWFLANTRVRVRSYYHGLIRAALASWEGRTIYLEMGDRSFWTADIMAWCDDHPVWHFRLRLK